MPRKQFALIIQSILALLIVEGVGVFAAGRLAAPVAGFEVRVPGVSPFQFLLGFAVGTALLLLIIRTVRARLAFEVIFALAIFAGIWFLFSTVVPSTAPLLAAAVVALRYILPYVIIQNLVMIAGVAGIATSLGAGTPWPSLALMLAILAVYDIIAVYGTHHMVTMFKGLLARGVILALIIPEHPRLLLKRLHDVQPGEEFFFLGTGDVALPTIFVVSALRVGAGPALGAAIGSMVGLLFTDLLFAVGHRRPMPALPPIALGTLAGFFVAMLVIRLV